MPAAGADQRIAISGALDYASGQVLWHAAPQKDGVGFAAFLEEIAQTWPSEDLVLVLDNVSYHRSGSMRAWWADQGGRILPFWLPASSPNLNLLERVWRFLKRNLACHRFWADRNALQQTAGALLSHTTARFHAPDRPAIRLAQDFCTSA